MDIRHRQADLQTNDLAKVMAQYSGFFKKYGLSIGILVGLGIVAAVILNVVQQRNAMAMSQAWTDYMDSKFTATEPEQLQIISRQAVGTPVASEALIYAADIQLNEGIALLFSDREEGLKKLNDAVAKYSGAVLSVSGEFFGQSQRAQLGMGRAQESLGILEEAKRSYERVVSAKVEPFSTLAQNRLDALAKPEAKKFYDWLANYQPPAPPADPSAVTPGLPAAGNLPDPLSLPSSSGGDPLIAPSLSTDSSTTAPNGEATAPSADSAASPDAGAESTAPAESAASAAATPSPTGGSELTLPK